MTNYLDRNKKAKRKNIYTNLCLKEKSINKSLLKIYQKLSEILYDKSKTNFINSHKHFKIYSLIKKIRKDFFYFLGQ